MPKLAYTDADGAPAEHVVRDEPVTIGKSATCDIRISGEGVARLHAVVEPSGTKLRVRDQESSGGTWVGGEKVTDAVLGDGDEFKVGGVTFKVARGGGASSRRWAGQGDEGEDGGPRSSRRSARRPKKEILGGARLSKTQQTIIKIVCAAVMLFCAAVIIGMINHWRKGPGVIHINKKTYVNLEDEPKKLMADAVEIARRARDAEQAGRTAEAYELMKSAKESAERAVALMVDLDEKHPGPTYWKLHKLRAEMTTRSATINSEAFRLEMQATRDGAGGD